MAPLCYTFGSHVFTPQSGDLRKHGLPLKLQRKPQQVLQALLERPGETVTRQELQARLWPSDSFVDFDQGLNVAIKKLRDALCDSAEQPRWVETVPGIGYRFIGVTAVQNDTPAPVPGPPPIGTTATPIGAGQIRQIEGKPDWNASPTGLVAGDFTISRRPGKLPAQWVAIAFAVFLLAVLLLAFGGLATRPRLQAKPLRASIALPDGAALVTSGDYAGLALSPDGTQLVFSVTGLGGQNALWLRRMDSLTVEPIPGTEGGSFPFWSPDGASLGYFADRELKRLNFADGTIIALCGAPDGRGGSWSKDNIILFAPGVRGPIHEVVASGGKPVPLTTLGDGQYTTHRWPVFLPDGKHFVFMAANHDVLSKPAAIYLGSLDGTEPKFLTGAESNAIPVSDALLFVSGNKLVLRHLDVHTASLQASASIIAETVQRDSGTWYANFTATTGTLLYLPGIDGASTHVLSWYSSDGHRIRDVGRGPYFALSLAPDGKTVATVCGDPDMNICLVRDDGTVMRITDAPINYPPAWSLDSSKVAFGTHRQQGSYEIAMKSLESGSLERVVMHSSVGLSANSWHPDGQHILVSRDDGDKDELLVLDVRTGGVRNYLPSAPGLLDGQISPDGQWVAYQSRNSGSDEVYISAFPLPTITCRVSNTGGAGPRWRGDSRELYFLGPAKTLYAATIVPEEGGLKIGAPRPLFQPPMLPAPWDQWSFDADRTGSKFVLATRVQDHSELVLLTDWIR